PAALGLPPSQPRWLHCNGGGGRHPPVRTFSSSPVRWTGREHCILSCAISVCLGPVMHPMFIAGTAQLERAFANRAKPCSDASRGLIVGSNEAGSSGQRKVPEQPVASGPRRFGRETLPPEGVVERIGDLRFRPVEWLEDAHTSDEYAVVNFFAGPHAVAAQRPSPNRR